MDTCVAVDCKSDTRHGKAKVYKFPRDENLEQQWLIIIKHGNIPLMQHARMCHTYCFG